jgi:hypothetical protein
VISFLILAQLLVATPAVDSTYATPALRVMVARAAAENRRPPPTLRSYRSHIETEMSLLIRDTLGRERSAEIEQLASEATWTRGDQYALHVLGYRAQNVGVPYSTLSLVDAWTVPTLYGERLTLGAYASRSRARNDTLVAVHPFAADRDQFYRFSGGDTVAMLRTGSRTISVARIRVHPFLRENSRLAAFDGEIDIDAERGQIIRMRGRLVVVGAVSGRAGIARRLGTVAAAYIEFVNAEIQGLYWLPTFQRTEFQASVPIVGQGRAVFRLVSTIDSITVNDSAVTTLDSARATRVTVTWAAGDSTTAFSDWHHDVGALTGSVHADDFDDVAPNAWRTDGPPRLDLFSSTTSRMVRFNRIEGLYTGLAPSINFRSVAPGLSAGAFGGWAWEERTARGGAFASYRKSQVILGVRAERSLASTNDFTPPFADDPGWGALLGSVDNYDYVDRRTAMMSTTRILGSVDRALATLEAGVQSDRAEVARLEHGLIPSGPSFRPNRGSANGTSLLGIAEVEVHPDVSSDFAQPGIGLKLHYEIGRGDLNWDRAELSTSVRKYFGNVSLATELDGGLVLGHTPPPQALFEIGGTDALPGYDYKQFSGDRAVLLKTFASYRLGIAARPRRVWRNFMLPGLSPGIAVSAQGGWSELSSSGAVAAARQLSGGAGQSSDRGTDGVRATLGAGVTLFSDIVHVGVAHPIEQGSRLRLVAGFGAAF